MPETRVLRFGEMIFRQKGSVTRRVVHAVISISLRLFFRRIETSGVEFVPASGPLVFVLNHPNGLIDPALVFCALPRRVSFLAKSTLFPLPVIGFLMRTMEALPLYRRIDRVEDLAQNQRTFAACHELLRAGRCIALFPEGVSHSSTQLLPVKTGAARIALGAISVLKDDEPLGDAPALRIIPVGLYYTSKTAFRSEALLRFGEYMEVNPVELDEDGQPPREEVRRLSQRIETALREVTLNVEDHTELEVVNKAEQLFSSLYAGLDIERSVSARFDFVRRFAAVRRAERRDAPARSIDALRQRIIRYEAEMRSMGMRPENLSLSKHSAWYVIRHFLVRSILIALLFPWALAGAFLHLPAYLLCGLLARIFRTHGADESGATVKVLAAIVLMPLTWIAFTALAYAFLGWRAAVIALPSAIVCGYVAMRSVEEIYDMRGWYKAVFVLLRRRGLFLRLLLERRSLHREIERLGSGARRI
ncbi:MAG TPA: 1-acyl-sn-glycerol-3-phosphate acyltransferase [Pyrinomonadaceae bacterium]|jgi:1-acyl-sn-glycerol-3-phosphate acyltransferase|nr:1-acyl-sn-glycerol-3-phosphate acyltransferase [Pyrinomonadaceae bacterium]